MDISGLEQAFRSAIRGNTERLSMATMAGSVEVSPEFAAAAKSLEERASKSPTAKSILRFVSDGWI
ncbi:MAG: hypothetical protein O2783_07050 [Chloroflexi bacterium]|nr:hypothetical protein [Chloroflexota bacterium]